MQPGATGSPALAIATVSTGGYAGILIGPPVIGFAADAISLPIALGFVVGLCALIRGARRTRRTAIAHAAPGPDADPGRDPSTGYPRGRASTTYWVTARTCAVHGTVDRRSEGTPMTRNALVLACLVLALGAFVAEAGAAALKPLPKLNGVRCRQVVTSSEPDGLLLRARRATCAPTS